MTKTNSRKYAAIGLGVCLVSLIVAFGLLHNNLQAWWGLIDDHEIVAALGSDRKLNWSEIPHQFGATEVGHVGSTVRFRPSYYIVRLMETAAWGDSPFHWYFFRIVIFAGSFALFWSALRWWIGWPLAFGVLIYCLTYRFWGDIFSRLGPSEIYCSLGLAMHVCGCVGVAIAIRKADWRLTEAIRPRYFALLSAGAVLAMGSKENFIFMSGSTGLMAYYVATKRRLDWREIFCLVFVIAYALVIAVVISVGLLRCGHDIYGNSASLMSRLELFGPLMIRQAWWKYWDDFILISVSASVVVAEIVLMRVSLSALKRPLMVAVLVEVVLVGLYISQFVFYNANWPTASRYDFPGILALPMTLVVIIWSGFRVLRTVGTSERTRRLVAAVLGACFLILAAIRGFDPLVDACLLNAHATRRFQQMFSNIISQVRGSPDRPIVLNVRYALRDYEPVVSFAKFLSANNIRNPVMIRRVPSEPVQDASELARTLDRQLEEWEKKGSPDGLFVPLCNMTSQTNVFGVEFSGRADAGCQNLGKIY